jgi:hypothetical protein
MARDNHQGDKIKESPANGDSSKGLLFERSSFQ